MSGKLYWNTVNPQLKSVLHELMYCSLFDPFRLVGGTSLSLQLGHRISVDIDLFTDAKYDSLDFKAIDGFLRNKFPYVTNSGAELSGLGGAYFLGNNETDAIKLDLYYTDSFIQPVLIKDDIRMATIEEIIAMKIDVIQRGGRKKDFWDLHELMSKYSPEKMLALHLQRYPYSHDETLIRKNFVDFTIADDDFDPTCLHGKYWELIKWDIIKALQ